MDHTLDKSKTEPQAGQVDKPDRITDADRETAKGPNLILHVHLLWEPWRSEPGAVLGMVDDIADLGFNAVNVEAKPWEEFSEYYRTAPQHANFYLDSVHTLLQAVAVRGLKHCWMGFWIFGENLDRIGVSPLRIKQGETCSIPWHLAEDDSLADRQYKTWSPRMIETLADHHEGLYRHFPGEMVSLDPRGPKRMITGCEFAVRPSFDEDGKARYRDWLKRRYHDRIDTFNAVYQTDYSCFETIEPADYWANYKGARIAGQPWRHWHPDVTEFLEGGLSMRRWVDNQLWRMDESAFFARALTAEYRRRDLPVDLWLWANQWKQFFQDRHGYPMWWHCDKGSDPWRMREHLGEVGFITSPSDCDHQSSAAALSAELAIARSINGFKAFHAGLFLGRHMAGDVFARVTPGESIATALLSGATRGLLAYGYNGLDDGGCLAQMPWDFRDSVRAGLRWFKAVQPRMAGSRARRTGILFPLATMLLEPVDTLESSGGQSNRQGGAGGPDSRIDFPGHRRDVLGWYQALCDAQYAVDFFHPSQVSQGALEGIAALVLPWCPAYRWMPDPEMERALGAWVLAGGVLVCGPDDGAMPQELRCPAQPHASDVMDVGEPLLADGPEIVSYEDLEPVATYRSGKTAIGVLRAGEGFVVRLGFHYGRSYADPTYSTVVKETHQSFYPASLMRMSVLGSLLGKHGIRPLWEADDRPDQRGIEIARDGNGWLVVNHANHVWPWPGEWKNPVAMLTDPVRAGGLLPHDAAWVPLASAQNQDPPVE